MPFSLKISAANAMEQIQLGKQDVVFAGGGEELNWSLTMLFDAMGALSSKYNESPTSQLVHQRLK
jgi:3-oxoacyl-[acyl-carrier-protein] synthase-1